MTHIGYAMRVDALTKGGGDVNQINKYIEHGKRMGLFSAEIVLDPREDLSRFDVIHLTNIDRPVDCYAHAANAQKYQKPTVISTIHHSYTEIELYEQQARVGPLALISKGRSFASLELLRSYIRARNNWHLIAPTIRCHYTGIRAIQQQLLNQSALVFTLSTKEQRDLEADIGAFNTEVHTVRNGLTDYQMELASTQKSKQRSGILIAGRIEARKNQINIINSLDQIKEKGTFIGAENPMHREYCRTFKKMIQDGGHTYLGAVSQSECQAAMQRHSVHVSASWFEVASLVDLEAHQNGCVVVSSICGSTNETLGERAEYAKPNDIGSISEAITRALCRSKEQQDAKNGVNTEQSIQLSGLTWEAATKSLGAHYTKLCQNSTPR